MDSQETHNEQLKDIKETFERDLNSHKVNTSITVVRFVEKNDFILRQFAGILFFFAGVIKVIFFKNLMSFFD